MTNKGNSDRNRLERCQTLGSRVDKSFGSLTDRQGQAADSEVNVTWRRPEFIIDPDLNAGERLLSKQ